MKPRFLLDEHMSRKIIPSIHAFDPTIDILHVGELGAPPLGTLDPEILVFCEAELRILITNNRASMPGHIADHFALGRHHWGVLKTRGRKVDIGEIVEEIVTIAGASESEEYYDVSGWIPF